MKSRPRLAVAAVGAFALVAAMLGACSQKTQEGEQGGQGFTETQGVIATDPKDSQGPAPAVQGATKGGTLRIIQADDYEHLDPQRNYTLNATALGHLIYRTLTAFRDDGKGKLTLVGDLATSPGKDVNKDCKVWEYTLKDNLKYEDGTPITADDVAFGITRSFDPDLSDGATYVQAWMADSGDYNATYKGPYKSADAKAPGLEVKDAKTLVFTFQTPRCDTPYAMSMNTTVPVPKAKDTKDKYDDRPFASGPYKIKEYSKGRQLVLERNSNWDPNTDPIRHDYPDQVFVEIGPDQTQSSERVVADRGDDQFAIAHDGIPQGLVPTVYRKPEYANRVIDAPTGLVWRISINNDRVKDLKVRQAIAFALDKQGILDVFGGQAAGTITHQILPEGTIGYKKYPNPYDGGPNGDPEKAKTLLGGQKVKLVMLCRQVDEPYLKACNVVKTSLERAGIEVVVTPIVRNQHNPTTERRGNPYDIYMPGWAPDWPSPASTLPVLFDGRSLVATGNSNNAYFNELTDEFARIEKLNANEAPPEYMKLDERIIKEYCPAVPIFQARNLLIMGSKVGGVFNSDAIGQEVYYNAYLKQ